MTRRATFWWSLAAVLVVVLGATWFFSEFTRVPTTRWEREGPEARKNRFLALERFFTRMGRQVRKVDDAHQLESLPAGGVLIMDRERRRHLPPERTAKLLRWVENGGYLIVAAEVEHTEDPILRRLGVSWYQPPKVEAKDEEDEDEDEGTKKKTVKPPPIPKTLPVSIAGAAPLALERFPPGLVVGKLAPLWAAEQEAGQAQVLHYAWGKGRITVFSNFFPFSNQHIGKYDHAELLWSLVSANQPKGPVWLAARLKVPTLWEWLADSAWMALTSGGVLVLLWLWRIVPRFGGLRPLPVPERRGLEDHLAAMGRGVWREGGLSHWLRLVRQSLLASIARRHPYVLQLPVAERAAALARLSGMSTARVLQALEGQGAISPRAFTETVRAIQQLQQRL